LPAGRKFGQITQNRPNKKIDWLEKFGSRTAADFGQKWPKKILYEKYEFSHDLLAFVSNFHKSF
jgi:hypothetical protein